MVAAYRLAEPARFAAESRQSMPSGAKPKQDVEVTVRKPKNNPQGHSGHH